MAVHSEISDVISLEGKVAVVTGGGSGIGQESARVLAMAGARVIATDVDVAGLQATQALLDEFGDGSTTRRVDVSSQDEVDALADYVVAGFGGVDVWVNSAGIVYNDAILDTKAASTERLFSINMLGTLWSCKAAGRVMQSRRRGSIINISSAGGAKPLPNMSAYGMSKAAVNSLTWTAATEFGPLGVRVNAIAPGFIETPIMHSLYSDESGQINPVKRETVLTEFAAYSPLGLMGRPSDIGYCVLYLASEAGRFVTGQVFRVNGGESM